MKFVIPTNKESNPFLQLLLLFAYAIAGFVVLGLLALAIILSIYGFDYLNHFGTVDTSDTHAIPALKILQISLSIGVFLVPPFFLAITEKKKLGEFYHFKKPNWTLLIVVFLLMAVSMPLMEAAASLNQKMALPDFLKSVEAWMRHKEEEAKQMTIMLLTMNNVWTFALNLFMIAFLPAIAEELMFRGGVQRCINRLYGNPHIAIWITAIIFSAIHTQFYGFIPRMLLGAMFGYIYLWSGSLWYAMFAHFINNGYAVCVAFYMQKNNIPLTDADKSINFAWYGYVISMLLTIALFKFFKDKTVEHERNLG